MNIIHAKIWNLKTFLGGGREGAGRKRKRKMKGRRRKSLRSTVDEDKKARKGTEYPPLQIWGWDGGPGSGGKEERLKSIVCLSGFLAVVVYGWAGDDCWRWRGGFWLVYSQALAIGGCDSGINWGKEVWRKRSLWSLWNGLREKNEDCFRYPAADVAIRLES